MKNQPTSPGKQTPSGHHYVCPTKKVVAGGIATKTIGRLDTKMQVDFRLRSYEPHDELTRSINIKDSLSRIVSKK